MLKVTNRKNIQSSCPGRGKWMDTFIKLHGQKQDIVNTATENIENRVANFEDMLKLTRFSPFQIASVVSKKNSKSTFDYTRKAQSSVPVSVNNFFKMTAFTHQNSLHKNKQEYIEYQCSNNKTKNVFQSLQNEDNDFSEQAQMKKLGKMIQGLTKYDQAIKQRQCLQKSRIQALQNAKTKLQEQQQGLEQFDQEFFRASKQKSIKFQNRLFAKTAYKTPKRHIKNASSQNLDNKSAFPFPTSMAKTQKQWHQLKQIEMKMQDKRLFVPLGEYSINNRFASLKDTIKSLQNTAKKQFGMKFKKDYKRSPEFEQELKQLRQKNKYIESNFATRDVSKINSNGLHRYRNSIDQFDIQQTDLKIDDNSIPKFLLSHKNKRSRLPSKYNGRRVMSSTNFKRQYVKML